MKPITRKILITSVLLSSVSAPVLSEPLIQNNVKRVGHEYMLYILKSDRPSICRKLCLLDPGCAAWRFVRSGFEGKNPRCYLERAVPPPEPDRCCVSGVKPAYLIKGMKIPEPWGKNFRVLVSASARIPGSRESFGWKERPEALGQAVPPSGAKGVLYLAPPNSSEPAIVEGRVRVPPRGGELLIRTAGNVNSSYRLVVRVNGRRVFSGEIDGSRWRTVRVNLSRWKGRTVRVELLGYPLGWFYNYIFIDNVELRSLRL